ncbi:MAG TPA: helix-turn-helix domain-containing protein [Terriglobales bacterium]|nr:helix-turn-helix domain-containing protein [Terriglobales bacterium]
MAKKHKTLEPQQERSRESLRKLLKAAAEVLGQHGVEGTTIPRIAEHAGLTPGAVYRRFRDKDELLETAILGILERQEERMKIGLRPSSAGQIPLPVFAESVIGNLVIGYRANAALLRAMRQFVYGRAQTPFWKKAARLEMRSFRRLVDLFLAHRDEIGHPQPRVAISVGLMMVISAIFEMEVMPQNPALIAELWKGLWPADERSLKRELVRAFLNCVGAKSTAGD